MCYKRKASDTGLTPQCSARLGISQRALRALARLEGNGVIITKLVKQRGEQQWQNSRKGSMLLSPSSTLKNKYRRIYTIHGWTNNVAERIGAKLNTLGHLCLCYVIIWSLDKV